MIYGEELVYRVWRMPKATARYRIDPVPGTSHKHWSFFGFYKRPKSHQEMALACDPEIKTFIRGRRQRAQLPNAWDDNPRSNTKAGPISWKRDKRRHRQWMR